MNTLDREVEAKFYVYDHQQIIERLVNAGGILQQSRIYERNLRFDTPDGALSRAHRVLRLRQDQHARLTYKGPVDASSGVADRQEIETGVEDLETTRRILEALGYRVSVSYEKYRTTYRLQDAEVVLDELPFGKFVEIEAPGAETIRQAAEMLGLDWEARCSASYLELYNRLKSNCGIDTVNLTFDDLEGMTFEADDLQILPADSSPDS
jgi:adenylate cyclase class 2